jgi:phage shock protein C
VRFQAIPRTAVAALWEDVMPTGPLVRSRDDRIIAGVCGGIAQWLGWDSTAVRVLYVLVSIFSAGFPGILVYIVLWVVMPLEE